MIYVVGSGPAGVACAKALLQRGLFVTMLDAGVTLDEGRRKSVMTLGRGLPETWNTEMRRVVASFKERVSANTGGIPLKYAYGSDFPYQDVERLLPVERRNADLTSSLARGGLSNVWGAAVMPYAQCDLGNWPFSLEDLAPHYSAILNWLDFSAVEDNLSEFFPVYGRPGTLQQSRQCTMFLQDLKSKSEILRASGIHFGAARLAVRAPREQQNSGCIYCGLCMYGCPYGLIYNSSATLESLLCQRNFRYLSDIIVRQVREKNGEILITAEDRLDGRPLRFSGSRLFLACGVLATTRILLDSLKAYDRPVKMADSQYFLVPMMRYQESPGVLREHLHTLAQVFIEILDTAISKNFVHLQVYTYNELFVIALRRMMSGHGLALFGSWVSKILGRLLIIQGYLHSDQSPHIELVLSRDGVMSVTGKENPDSRRTVIQVLRKLMRHRPELRAIPVTPMLKLAAPGRGFHSGGTFPMRAHPTHQFESDIWGRPTGFERVHAVDATVFPDIAATTITLTVMANAHRIAHEFKENPTASQ